MCTGNLAEVDEGNGFRPEVSVVIPCYNRGEMVLRAAQSALSQKGVDVEVIVVDDASTEDIEASLNALNDHRLRIVKLNENVGAARARNRGVQVAKGSYVAFLDSDDWWLEDKLSRQLEVLKRCNLSADKWIIYNKIKIISPGEISFKPSREFSPQIDDLSHYLLVQRNYMQTSGLLAKTSTFINFPFSEDCKRHQDIELLLRLHRAGAQLIYCDSESVHYFDHLGLDRVGRVHTVAPTIEWINKYKSYLTKYVISFMYVSYVGFPLLKRGLPFGIYFILKGVIVDPKVSLYVFDFMKFKFKKTFKI